MQSLPTEGYQSVTNGILPHVVQLFSSSPSYNLYAAKCLAGTRFSYNKSSLNIARVAKFRNHDVDDKEQRRHALVDGSSSGLGDEKVRPDRPQERKTSKDEADVAAEVRFVGIDATGPR